MKNFSKTALAAALALSAAPVFAADFKQLDSNNDQQLSRSELQSHAEQRKLSADQLIQSFDRDNNRQLSQQEFANSTTAPMEVAEAEGSAPSQPQSAAQQPAEVSAHQQANASEQPGASSEAAGSPDRTTITVNQKPAKVTVSNTAPKVTVQQPKPQVSIETREPVVNVEQPEPTVTVNQSEPEVSVDAGRPAVDVDQADPRVAVEQPEPTVSTEMAEPEVSTQAAQPIVNIGSEQRNTNMDSTMQVDARSEWANQSVGDLEGETLYDQNGQKLGEIDEVVLDAQQRPGLLIDAEDQSEQTYILLESVSLEQDQLRVSGAEQARPLSEVQDVDGSQLQPVTDANRSIDSLLNDSAVSAR